MRVLTILQGYIYVFLLVSIYSLPQPTHNKPPTSTIFVPNGLGDILCRLGAVVLGREG
ncbi:hypothetical protein GMOD_00002531 [Pyrenophora seminiperda CCB06]|uniref:Uncharacterized protein n=1 Tax=Pyrenophora seminiperda CCB06 TaxID=1302712 RepID=A0A3M7M2G1_9PLEO|nr:hypothetical protein GMOD_00002531 [Pyrenophora seminiperda CCB06]